MALSERIDALAKLTLAGEMYVHTVKTEKQTLPRDFSRIQRECVELCDYILNQEPLVNNHIAFTGRFNFDGTVVGDAFKRGGHKYNQLALEKYYLKPIDNLSTMEWQHATADYTRVLHRGITGIIEDIEASLKTHTDKTETEFLFALRDVANTLIKWSEKCSQRVRKFVKNVEKPEDVSRLLRLADALLRVPKHGAATFYEAILAIFICFSADPDSIGTLDRYLTPFYKKDIDRGILTPELAKEYLQELFLMLQASTPKSSVHFTRGGESHFCIGGYSPDGEDCFNEVSRLIAESMVELPTYIPQLTLRWTAKLPYADFKLMMELERNDPHKRIAFTNDEKRIKCYTEVCGIPYERAVSYTTVGCNEPAFLGAITGSTSKGNILRCIERMLHDESTPLEELENFDSFYKIFEAELFSDLEKILYYDDMYNKERAKDYSYISSLFFKDCIENAKSPTQGGGNTVIASPMLIGITNLIDSLIAIKEIVYGEQIISLAELSDALKANWQGYEDIRRRIISRTHFFGNSHKISMEIPKRLYGSLHRFYKDKRNIFGYQFLVGDLLGYNEHHKWFGSGTRATPDGRYDGDMLKFGIGQSEGRDKDGLTSLLNAIATLDENAIGCGSTVTNISVDKSIIEDDSSFDKLIRALETYFKLGGVHFQLTYVSREELISAQAEPERYSGIRVRVTGFSDYFVKLKKSIQDDIISRTEHK